MKKGMYWKALVVAGLLGLANVASAAVDTLTYLVTTPGATITSGTMTFGNFTWGGPSGPAGLTVTTIGNGTAANPYGIELGGGLAQIGPGTSDWQWSYSVTASGPKINDIELFANFNPLAGATVLINEDARNGVNGPVVAQATAGTAPYTPTATAYVANPPGPLSTLWVYKDIFEYVGPSGGTETISTIDQQFSVPEPTTVAAGIGAVLLAALGLRRRAS